MNFGPYGRVTTTTRSLGDNNDHLPMVRITTYPWTRHGSPSSSKYPAGRGVLYLAWWFQYQRYQIQCRFHWLRTALYTLCVPQRCETRCRPNDVFFVVGFIFLLFLNLGLWWMDVMVLRVAWGIFLVSPQKSSWDFFQGLGCESPRSMLEIESFPPQKILITSWWMEIRNENPPLLLKMADPAVDGKKTCTICDLWNLMKNGIFSINWRRISSINSIIGWIFQHVTFFKPTQNDRMPSAMTEDGVQVDRGCHGMPAQHACLTMLRVPVDPWIPGISSGLYPCASCMALRWWNGLSKGYTTFTHHSNPRRWARVLFGCMFLGTTGRTGVVCVSFFCWGLGGDGILVGAWNASEVRSLAIGFCTTELVSLKLKSCFADWKTHRWCWPYCFRQRLLLLAIDDECVIYEPYELFQLRAAGFWLSPFVSRNICVLVHVPHVSSHGECVRCFQKIPFF